MKTKDIVKKHYPLKMLRTGKNPTTKLMMIHEIEERERGHYEKEVKVIRCIFGGLM